MTSKEKLDKLISENSNMVFSLSASVVTLDALQNEVSALMEKVDRAMFNKYFGHSNIAYIAIREIEQRLRIIDVAFRHTNNDIQKEVAEVEASAEQLLDAKKEEEKEKSSLLAATSNEQISI